MAAGKAGKAGERPIAAFAPDMSLLEAAKRKHPHASVLTAGQEAGLQLLQVADHLQQLGEAGMGVKASTVYEMVAEPISNAISQLMPKQYVHIRNIRGGCMIVQSYRFIEHGCLDTGVKIMYYQACYVYVLATP